MKTIAYMYLTDINHIYYYNPDKTKDYLFKMNHRERIIKAVKELKHTRRIAVYLIKGKHKRLLYIKN